MSNPAQRFIFIWEIKNFNLSLLKAGQILKSPVFEMNALKNMKWYLKILIEENAKYISCSLYKVESLMGIRMKFSIKLINSDKEELEDTEKILTFSEKHLGLGYKNFYEIDKLEKITGPVIIRCIMTLVDSQKDFDCKGRTKIAIDRSYFQWNVKEIESDSWKASKIFSCSPMTDIEISLSAPEDQVKIIIKNVSKGHHKLLYLSCRLSLIDIKEIERDSRKSEHVFKSDDGNDTWQYPSFLQKSLLETQKSKYVKNGTFTIMCEFSISTGESFDYLEEYNNNELVSIHSGSKEDPLTVLQEDLQRMYTNNLQTDIDLRIDNQAFKAHKSLLSARSPVFAAMFEQDMLENQSGIVDIFDVEPDIMELFLKFLYSGLIENLDYESTSKLLIVADKYQVSSLKKECSSILMSNLTTANVCDVVMLANMINEKTLKASAMEYIASKANVVLISESWSRCIQNDIKLATEIMSNLSVNIGTKIEK